MHTRLAWHSPSLHSWGNQCIDCACRCRGPLSEARLHAHGLYGVLLVFAPGQSPDRNVRHLSGREMAVLTGFAKSDGWRTMDGPPMVSHCRCWSSSVTIQAAWIFTAVFNHLINNGFCAGDKIPPKQILGCVAMYLFKLRDEWFGPERTLAMEMFQEALEKFLDPGPPPSLPAQADSTFQDTTASQGEAIANNIADIEKKVSQHPKCEEAWIAGPSLNHSGDSGHFTHAHPSEDAASSQASMPSHACRTYPRSC